MSSHTSNLLATSAILDQSSLNDNVIAIPIHFMYLNEVNQSDGIQGPSSQTLTAGSNFILDKSAIHTEANEANLLQSQLNSLAIKHDTSEMKGFIVNPHLNHMVNSESSVIGENHSTSMHHDVSDAEDSLVDRQVFLQIGDGSINEGFDLNDNQNDCLMSSNLLVNSGEFAPTGKDVEGRRYTVGIVDGQVVWVPTESEFENAISVEAASLNSNENEFLHGSLMVTKLLKEENQLQLDDQIAESQTITINNNLDDDLDTPLGSGPWTCQKCNITYDKWIHFKKHVKRHEEDKPFQCLYCPQSFNVKKNLELHLSLHRTDGNICSECGKEFRRIASLKAHLMLHEEEEIVVCNRCDEEFFSLNQLQSHSCKEGIHKITIENLGEVSSTTSTGQSGVDHIPPSSTVEVDPLILNVNEIKKETIENDSLPSTFTCKKCTATFSSSILLKNHTLVHKRMKKLASGRPRRKFTDRSMFDQKCSTCNKTFLKPSQLLRHIRIHTGEKPFKCTHPGCGRAFTQKGTMLIHMDIHSGEKAHICEFCDKAFVQKSNLRAHMKRVHPANHGDEPRLQCEECPCVFKKANSLNAHIAKAHGPETFLATDSDDLEVHSLLKHLQEVATLKILKSKFTNPETKVKLEVGQENQMKVASLEDGQPAVNQNIKSSRVDDILQEALKNSGLTPLKDSGKERRSDNLSGPGKKFQKVMLTNVIDRTPNGDSKRYPVLVRIQQGSKKYLCAFDNCQKEFKKPSDLVRHIRVHTHERPFKCPLCPRAFSIKATLSSHMSTHNGEKKFSCEKCQKKFLTKGALKAHRMCHTGAKPYQCPKCVKSFRTLSHQKAHLLTHSQSAHRQHALKKKAIPLPDIPLEEPFLITNQGPVKQVSRYSHVYLPAGTSDPERPHKCRYCSAAFKKSSHAKQHERTHTGERPYKCDFCFKSFNSTSVLRSHYKTHAGLKPYKCATCEKRFTSDGSLKRHHSIHTSNRPYMCPYCRKTFKTNTNCKKHMKTHKHELAMDAVRAAGESLQGDSEQALLTTIFYKQLHSNSPVELPVISLEANDSNTGSPTKQDCLSAHGNDSSLKKENSALLVEGPGQTMISIEQTPSQVNSDSMSHIQATFSQDLANGGITISNLEKEASLPSRVEFLAQTSQSSVVDQTSLLLAQDRSLIPEDSKIILSSISRDPSESASINAIIMPPGAIIGPGDNDPQYIISTPSLHKLDDQTVQLSFSESISDCEKSNTSVVPALPATSFSGVMPNIKPNRANKKYDILHHLPPEMGTENVHNLPNAPSSSIEVSPGSPLEVNASTPRLKSHSNEIMETSMLSDGGRPEQNRIILFNIGSLKDAEEEIDTPSEQTKSKPNSEIAAMGDEEELSEGEILSKEFQEDSLAMDQEKIPLVAHWKAKKMPTSKFQCNFCKNSYKSASAYRSHMKFHKRTRQCKTCGESIPHKSFKEHKCEQNAYKACKLCNQTFCGEEKLISHIKDAHKEIREGQEMQFIGAADKSIWRCPVCKLFFSSSDAIQKHLPSHSQEEISAGMAKDLFEQTVWAMSSHKSKRKLELSSQAVDALVSETGVEDKLEISQHPNRGRVNVPERQGSCGEFRYVCETCNKGFKKPSDLVRHTRTHTGEKPFSCKLCQKKFAVNSTLLVHMRTHTGKKEFKCPTCKDMYSSKGSLKIHMRIHTGAKPLKCQFCGLKFRTSGHRKAHIAKHFRVNNFKDLDVLKKSSFQQSQPEPVLGASSRPTKIEGNDEILQNSPDPLGLCPLTVNPDGTISIHFPNYVNVNENQEVSIQTVNFEDNIMNQFNSLEFPEDPGENSLRVDPNSIIANPIKVGSPDAQKKSLHSDRTFGPLSSNNLNVNEMIDSGSSDTQHIISVSDLVVINKDDCFECSFCSETFTKFTDHQEHIVHHGFVDRELETSDLLKASSRRSDSPIRANTEKEKGSNICSFFDCQYKYCDDKDYQHHLAVSHNARYQCPQYFSYSQMEKSLESFCHNDKESKSRLVGTYAMSSSESAKLNESMEESIAEPSRTEPMDEDFEPLVKDIFLN